MVVKPCREVIPLSDLKANAARVIRRVTAARHPVLLMRRGRGVAVVQSVADFNAAVEEREFMRAVVAGLSDLEAGRDLSLAEAMKRLGID